MKCLEPVTIKVPYKDIDGNPLKNHFRWVEVPCGKCPACLSRRKDEWVLRLKQEYRNSVNSQFVTLTYNELSVPLSVEGKPTLRMADLSAFIKRLRKRISKYSDLKLRFFGCGEYGSQFNRPHYHILLFNCPKEIANDIAACWPFGFTKCDPMTEQRIGYTCKYVLSSTNLVDTVPFTFGSRGLSVRSLLYDVQLDLQSALVSLPGLSWKDISLQNIPSCGTITISTPCPATTEKKSGKNFPKA